jgi:hypothetical protein
MKTMLLIFLIVLAGCETKEHADAELGALKKAKDAARAASSRANMSASQEIGVPECDAYIKSYESCLNDKVPEDKRDALRSTLDDQRKKWQDAVGSGTDAKQIADQCRSAVADATTKMGEYGCAF